MATVYKCDRCGCFYEKKPVNKPGLGIIIQHSLKDLCGSCLKELVCFYYGPINAQKKEKENV